MVVCSLLFYPSTTTVLEIMPSLDPLVGLCLSIMDVFRFTEDLEGRYDVVQN